MNRFTLSSLLLFLVFVVSGCVKDDEIRSYDVENLSKRSPFVAQDEVEELKLTPERIVGAIVPVGKDAWFFKMQGASKAVNVQLPKMLEFMNTLKASDKTSALTWKLPDGWKEEKGQGMRAATIQVGGGVEMSVIKLPIFGDSWDKYLLSNINRWRGQVSREHVTLDRIIKVSTKADDFQEKISKEDPNDYIFAMELKGGLKVVFVNCLGTKKAGSGMRPPFAHGQGGPMRPPMKKPTPPAQTSFKQTVPKEWKQGRMSVMRKAAYEVNEGTKKVEITVMTAGGELLPNVNRWRGQVNLKPVTKDELKKSIQPIKIDGYDGMFFELIGAQGKSIFAVMVKTDDKTQWFIKLTGDSKIAAKEKERFLTYAKSIQF